MSSGYTLVKSEPGLYEILEALREANSVNPRLTEMPAEEVARQLMQDDRLPEEPSLALIADMLDAMESEEDSFEADEFSGDGHPT